jgi:hypothetical protein
LKPNNEKWLKSSFSLELWIKPRLNLINDDIVIFSIDSDTKSCSSTLQFVQTSVSPSFSSSVVNELQFSLLFCNKYGSSGYLPSPVLSPPLTVHNESKLIHIVTNIEFSNYTLPSSKGTPITLCEVTVSYTVNGITYDSQSVTATSVTTSYFPFSWPSTALILIHVFPLNKPSCFSLPSSVAALYRLVLYSTALSSSEQQLLYSFPLPSNPLITSNFTRTIQENGQIGDHSSDPSYFLQPIANTALPVIAFHVYSFDFDPSNPFSIVNLQRMKEREKEGNHSLMVELLLSIGTMKGVLYDLNGNPLSKKSSSSSSLIFIAQQQDQDDSKNGEFSITLRYRPPFNQFSSLSSNSAENHPLPFTILSYRAYRNDDGLLHRFSETVGTAAILVQQVYRPPSPSIGLSSTGIARTMISLTLSGSVDKIQKEPTNKIIGALITSSPLFGTLFSSNDAGESSEITSFPHLLSLSPLSSAASSVTTSGLHLSYYYTGAEDGKNIVGIDSFSFGVIDSFNLSSISTNYSLIIRNALTIDSSSLSFTCNEDDEVSSSSFSSSPVSSTALNVVTLKGNDLSFEKRKLRIRILSFPSFGSFDEIPTSSVSQQQQQFFIDHPLTSSNYSFGVSLHYQQRRKDYFTFPFRTWDNYTISSNLLRPDSFSYQIETFGSSEISSAKSSPVTAAIAEM